MLRFFTFLTFILVALAKENPTVKIKDGTLEGHILKTINGREIAAFEGVPYAKPPIGSLRFEPPEPNTPWLGTWKANKVHICMQYPHSMGGVVKKIQGHEDCLYLNVYKPNEKLNNLDVIVYIHGGTFMGNFGGLYRPFYLLDKNVVFVTINYRLGPLGFLSLEDEILPGNNGLKDQNLALKWIKENIKYFGGNPNSITIVGMSAGGASVHLHTLSTQSKGLFNKVISQSGVPTNPWVLTENAKQKALKLANLLGCATKELKDVLDCLKTRPAQHIVELVRFFQVFLYNPFTPFGVVIDKTSKDPFLPEHPLTLMKKNQIADVPIMFTFVECEGLYPGADFPTNMKNFDEIDKNWNDVMPHILDYSNTISKKNLNEISSKIRKEYLKDTKVSMSTYDDLVQMMSDRLFIKDIVDVTLKQSKAIKSPVYSYKFSYVGAHGHAYFHAPHTKFNCTSHGDDTFYVISPVDFMRTTAEDTKMSDILIKIWTSFAKNGSPTIDNIEWLPVTKEEGALNYLHIKSPKDMKMKIAEDLGRASFWNKINFKENIGILKKDEL